MYPSGISKRRHLVTENLLFAFIHMNIYILVFHNQVFSEILSSAGGVDCESSINKVEHRSTATPRQLAAL
jgi:hypothetical protein